MIQFNNEMTFMLQRCCFFSNYNRSIVIKHMQRCLIFCRFQIVDSLAREWIQVDYVIYLKKVFVCFICLFWRYLTRCLIWHLIQFSIRQSHMIPLLFEKEPVFSFSCWDLNKEHTDTISCIVFGIMLSWSGTEPRTSLIQSHHSLLQTPMFQINTHVLTRVVYVGNCAVH